MLEAIASFKHGIPVRYIKCQLLACSAVMACDNLFCLLFFFLLALSAQTQSAHESFFQNTKVFWERQRERRRKFALVTNVRISQKEIVGAHTASLQNLFLSPMQINVNLLTFRGAGRLHCLMSLAFERN